MTQKNKVDSGRALQGKLGAGSLMMLIIAASAPLTAVAGGAPTSYAVTGMIEVPMGYLVLGIVLLVFAVGYAAMSTKITNAGALYAYTATGLGKRQGLAAAWLALVSYNAMQIGLYGIVGATIAGTLSALAGITIQWWVAALFCWFLTGLLGAMNIDASAKVIGVLVILEFLVVVLVDFIGLSSPAEPISVAAFDPSGFVGPGIGAALAFGMAAFMGFESATIYAEEAENPQKSVPKATYGALGLIAGFYAFSAWAIAQGVGESQIVEKARESGPELLFVFLEESGHHGLATFGRIIFITSLLAALFAFHNAVARYALVLGREGVLPERLGRTHPKTHAPIYSSLAQSALALLFIGGFAIYGSVTNAGPEFPVLTMFSWLTNAGAFGIVFLLFITSVSVVRFFWGTNEHNLFVRLIAPVAAMVGLAVIFVQILVHFDVMVGEEGFHPLVVGMPSVILLTGVAGYLRAEWLRRANPTRYSCIGTGMGSAELVGNGHNIDR
ncbi:APC family permease [Corynebacterium pseudopelargi]|uniref:Putative amino acid permease YhdG n=1 Tax=Corynebacterium pseudopelargi TaxID=2080757 RepID=A0A3G6J0S6_9CORY|nr:APC family permease [Corynebacterium pseudopelargi]AZA09744.1 putative amino acid permease YhdG [Corynebacterium pseudopelargi]